MTDRPVQPRRPLTPKQQQLVEEQRRNAHRQQLEQALRERAARVAAEYRASHAA